MVEILFATIIGFLTGLTFLVIKRKIRLSSILSATFFGVLLVWILKMLKDSFKTKGRRKHF